MHSRFTPSERLSLLLHTNSDYVTLESLNERDEKTGLLLLELAIQEKNYRAIKLLVEKGYQFKKENKDAVIHQLAVIKKEYFEALQKKDEAMLLALVCLSNLGETFQVTPRYPDTVLTPLEGLSAICANEPGNRGFYVNVFKKLLETLVLPHPEKNTNDVFCLQRSMFNFSSAKNLFLSGELCKLLSSLMKAIPILDQPIFHPNEKRNILHHLVLKGKAHRDALQLVMNQVTHAYFNMEDFQGKTPLRLLVEEWSEQDSAFLGEYINCYRACYEKGNAHVKKEIQEKLKSVLNYLSGAQQYKFYFTIQERFFLYDTALSQSQGGDNLLHSLFKIIRFDKTNLPLYLSILKTALEKSPTLLESKNQQGRLPLHELCLCVDDGGVCKEFFTCVLEKTTEWHLSQADQDSNISLKLAVKEKNYHAVNMLVVKSCTFRVNSIQNNCIPKVLENAVHQQDESMLTALFCVENLSRVYTIRLADRLSSSTLLEVFAGTLRSHPTSLPLFKRFLENVVVPNKENNINDGFKLNTAVRIVCSLCTHYSDQELHSVVSLLFLAGAKFGERQVFVVSATSKGCVLHCLAEHAAQYRMTFRLVLQHASLVLFDHRNEHNERAFDVLLKNFNGADMDVLEVYLDCHVQAVKKEQPNVGYSKLYSGVLIHLLKEKKYKLYFAIQNRMSFLKLLDVNPDLDSSKLKALCELIRTGSFEEVEKALNTTYTTLLSSPHHFVDPELLNLLISLSMTSDQPLTFIYLCQQFIFQDQADQLYKIRLDMAYLIDQFIHLNWTSKNNPVLNDFLKQLISDVRKLPGEVNLNYLLAVSKQNMEVLSVDDPSIACTSKLIQAYSEGGDCKTFIELCKQTVFSTSKTETEILHLPYLFLHMIEHPEPFENNPALNACVQQLAAYTPTFDIQDVHGNNLLHWLCVHASARGKDIPFDAFMAELIVQKNPHYLHQFNMLSFLPFQMAYHWKHYSFLQWCVKTDYRLKKEDPTRNTIVANIAQSLFYHAILAADLSMAKALVTIESMSEKNGYPGLAPFRVTPIQFVAHMSMTKPALIPVVLALLKEIIQPEKKENTEDRFQLHACFLYTCFIVSETKSGMTNELERIIHLLFECGADLTRDLVFGDTFENALHLLSKKADKVPFVFKHLLTHVSLNFFNKTNVKGKRPLDVLVEHLPASSFSLLEEYMDCYFACAQKQFKDVQPEMKQAELARHFFQHVESTSAKLIQEKNQFIYFLIQNRIRFIQNISTFKIITKEALSVVCSVIQKGSVEELMKLLNEQFKVLVPAKDQFGNHKLLGSLLALSATSKNVPVFIYLCKTFIFPHKDINFYDAENLQLARLMVELIRLGWFSKTDPEVQDCIRAFMRYHPDFSWVDAGGNNVLHVLMENIQDEKKHVQFYQEMFSLIAKRTPALLDQGNNKGQLPLHILSQVTNDPVYDDFIREVLSSTSAQHLLHNDNERNNNPLKYAAENQSYRVVKRMVDFIYESPTTAPGVNDLCVCIGEVLWSAVREGKLELVRSCARIENLFLKKENLPDTIFVWAISCKNPAIFYYFLDELLYPNIKSIPEVTLHKLGLTRALYLLCVTEEFHGILDKFESTVIKLFLCGGLKYIPKESHLPNGNNPLHILFGKGEAFQSVACVYIQHASEALLVQKNHAQFTPLQILMQQDEKTHLNTLKALLPDKLGLNDLSFTNGMLDYLEKSEKKQFHELLEQHKHYLLSSKDELLMAFKEMLLINFLPMEVWQIIFEYCVRMRDPRFSIVPDSSHETSVTVHEFSDLMNGKYMSSADQFYLLRDRVTAFLDEAVKQTSIVRTGESKIMIHDLNCILDQSTSQEFNSFKFKIGMIQKTIQAFLDARSFDPNAKSQTIDLLLKHKLIQKKPEAVLPATTQHSFFSRLLSSTSTSPAPKLSEYYSFNM